MKGQSILWVVLEREELGKPLAIPSSATFQASVPRILQPQQVHPRLVALDLPGKGGETALSVKNLSLPCWLCISGNKARAVPWQGPLSPACPGHPCSQSQHVPTGKAWEEARKGSFTQRLEPSSLRTFSPSGPSSPGGPRSPVPPCSGHKQRSLGHSVCFMCSQSHKCPLPGQ